MHILVIPEFLSALSAAGKVNAAGVLQSLQEEGHRLTIIGDKPELPCFYEQEGVEWIVGPEIFSLLEENKIRAFLNPDRKRKQEAIREWERTIRNIAGSFDLVLSLPFYNSFCSCMGMSRVETKLPWVVHFPQALFGYFYEREEKKFAEKGNRFFWQGVETVLHQAPFVSFASIYAAEYMKLHYKYLRKKTLYLPYHESVLSASANDGEPALSWDGADFNILFWGDMYPTLGIRRFFSAYEQFLDYLGTARRRVILHVFGEVDRQFMRPGLTEHVKTETCGGKEGRQVVVPSGTTVLLMIDPPGGGAYCFPPQLPVYMASGKPLMTVTQQKSETGRLLGADYPYSCGYSDESDIILLLLLMWEQWQTGDLQGIRREDVMYLFGPQNYNTVLSMAVRQYRGQSKHCYPAG